MENQRTKDCEYLRAAIKRGEGTTLIYTLLSHMRGKLHMHWYNKYHGGWRSHAPVGEFEKDDIPVELHKAYGTAVRYYYARTVIRNLDDQAVWITTFMNSWLSEIANRVVAGYEEPSDPSLQSETTEAVAASG